MDRVLIAAADSILTPHPVWWSWCLVALVGYGRCLPSPTNKGAENLLQPVIALEELHEAWLQSWPTCKTPDRMAAARKEDSSGGWSWGRAVFWGGAQENQSFSSRGQVVQKQASVLVFPSINAEKSLSSAPPLKN